MFYVIQTYRTGTFQVVQTSKRSFAEKYGTILFETAWAAFAQRICRGYQLKKGEIIYD